MGNERERVWVIWEMVWGKKFKIKLLKERTRNGRDWDKNKTKRIWLK